jgi:cytochrome b561
MKNLLVSRFHPLLVTMHWLVAALIIALLCVGFFLATAMPNSDPQKPTVLMWHMAGGMFVAFLMTLRLAVRLFTSRPADATTGYPRLDRVAKLTHYGFYVLVFLMAGTGLATAILAGLNRIVFQGSGEPLPASFATYPTFVAHFFLACLLIGFLIAHVLAALFHHFVLKDGLLRRMWFGKRTSVAKLS